MSEDKNNLNVEEEQGNAPQQQPVEYTDDNIRHLSDMEHVRTRPGMYIGRLGDGNLPEDGIYVLLKEANLSRRSACSILEVSMTARRSRRVSA